MSASYQQFIDELVRAAVARAKACVALKPAREGETVVALGYRANADESLITLDCTALQVPGLKPCGTLFVYAEPPLLTADYKPDLSFESKRETDDMLLSGSAVTTIPSLLDLMPHLPDESCRKVLDPSHHGHELRRSYAVAHHEWIQRHGVSDDIYALVGGWDPYEAASHELAEAAAPCGIPVMVAFLQDGRAAGAVWMNDCGTILGGIYMT